MKPVAVIRHSSTCGPGFFGDFLDRGGVPWQLLKIDEGNAVPADGGRFSGLAFMGGPMSVNDDLPWIAPALALIRDAVDAGVPVIGHCLGGQLMAKALGGVVTRNPVEEIGWGRIDILPRAESRRWLGDDDSFESFHWHGETFSIPAGAVRIACSDYCENQMFSMGKHLGMQCHMEMTPSMITQWCDDWKQEVRPPAHTAQRAPSIQTPDQMLADVVRQTSRLHAVASRLYEVWLQGLFR